MKVVNIFAVTIIASCMSTGVFAQETKELKKEVRKEVVMQEENGEKVLTITTTEDGKISKEVYKGQEAEQKLSELNGQQPVKEVREEVKVEELNGEKVVTIVKTENGVSTTEVYKGAEADAKLKEIQMQEGLQQQPKQMQMKKLEVQKTQVKSRN